MRERRKDQLCPENEARGVEYQKKGGRKIKKRKNGTNEGTQD